MHPYSQNETKRHHWVQRINQVIPTRKRELKLKTQLLTLLNLEDADDAIKKFELRRAQLLSSNHGQGFSWAPHSGFFWNFIKIFIGLFIKITLTGSLLRQTLESEKSIHLLTTATEKKLDQLTIEQLSQDESFEELMRKDPEKALQIVRIEIAELLPPAKENPEGVMKVLKQLYALRLYLEPMNYFNLLQKISRHAPGKALSFLYQQYDNQKYELNEHTFIELHLMAQILIEQCVISSGTTINQHLYNIHYLLILMKADPSLIDAFMEAINNSEQNLHTTLDEVYAANRDRIIGDLVNKTPKNIPIIENLNESPINILEMQFQYSDAKIHTPLTYSFSRLALEIVLMDNFDDTQKGMLSNNAANKPAGQRSLTIHLLSKKLFHTWTNKPLTAETASRLLTIQPFYSLVFSSFKALEEDWVSPLIFSLKQGCSQFTKKILPFTQEMLLSKLERSELTPNQIEWIVTRVQFYFPEHEVIEQIRALFLFHEDWLKPLHEIIENCDPAIITAASAKIDQNMCGLLNGSRKLCEEHYTILVQKLQGSQQFNQPNDLPTEIFKQLLKYTQSKETKTVIPTTNTKDNTPLLANSFYTHSKNTNEARQRPAATPTKEASTSEMTNTYGGEHSKF